MLQGADAYERSLLHRVPAILYTADARPFGAWRYVSPQIEAILGFTPEEWTADPNLWARQLHPDDREGVLAAEAKTVHGGPSLGAAEYRGCCTATVTWCGCVTTRCWSPRRTQSPGTA